MTKQKIILIFLLMLIFSITASSQDEISNYKIDVRRSYIRWTASKLTRAHYGRVYLDSSYIAALNGKINDGFFSVDMNSIINSDVQSKKENQQLVKHLKSNVFFDVQKHPFSTIKIIKAIPNVFSKNGQPNYTLVGELTIKDSTQIITFPAYITLAGKSLRGKAVFSFDRTKFGMRFNSEKYFPKIGKLLIHDQVKLEIVIIGIRNE
ncbi:MAG: YceI family protein [bacterium]